MIAVSLLTETQYRLARHYLKKLQTANATILRGHINQSYWGNAIESDWLQIKKWQQWAANWHDGEQERAQVCAAFGIDTSDILRAKQSPSEHLIWIQEALLAAQAIDDINTEFALLFQLGVAHLNLEVIDAVDDCAHELKQKAHAHENTLFSGRASYLLGASHLLRGNYDVAEERFEDALDNLMIHDAKDEIARSVRGIGRAALYRGDYQDAYTRHIQYLEIAEDLGNIREVGVAHVALCGMLIMLHNYPEAEYHARSALTIAQNNGFQRMVPAALISLADTEKRQDKLDDAVMHFEEGIKIARVLSPPSTVTAGLMGLGRVCLLQGKVEKAHEHYHDALQISREAQLRFRICDLLHDMVYLHLALDDLDNAFEAFKELCLLTRQINTSHFTTRTLSVAIVLWQQRGMHEQSATWLALLEQHKQYLPSDLFDYGIGEKLESALGRDAYHQAYEQGKSLTLIQALEQLLVYSEN